MYLLLDICCDYLWLLVFGDTLMKHILDGQRICYTLSYSLQPTNNTTAICSNPPTHPTIPLTLAHTQHQPRSQGGHSADTFGHIDAWPVLLVQRMVPTLHSSSNLTHGGAPHFFPTLTIDEGQQDILLLRGNTTLPVTLTPQDASPQSCPHMLSQHTVALALVTPPMCEQNSGSLPLA